MIQKFWESARIVLSAVLAVVTLVAGTSEPRLLAQEKPGEGEEPAKEGAKEKAEEPTPTFEELQAQFEKEKSLEVFNRVPTLEKFAKVRTKKSVEFLASLYTAEPTSGLVTVVTTTLGRIGTEDAVKALILQGMSYFLEPPHVQGANGATLAAVKDEMKYLIESMGVALSCRLEPKAEDWLVKNGLTPLVRKDSKATEIVLKAIAGLKTKSRLPVIIAEVTRTTSPQIQIDILEALRKQAGEKDDRIGATGLHFVKAQNAEVQLAAYDLLAAVPGTKYRSHFAGGLKNPSWEVRVACLDAMLASQDKDLVKHATQLLKDPDSKVQVTAVQALLKHGGAEVIEPLFHALEKSEGRVQDDLADALARLTGKNFGTAPAQWESWWAQNKASGRSYTAMSAEEFAALKEEDKKQATSATPLYFGLRVLSSNAAFLMDCSESMNEEYTPAKLDPGAEEKGAEEKKESKGTTVVVKSKKPEGPPEKGKAAPKAKKKGASRLDVAKKELLDVVGRLREGCGMNILTFNSLITDFTATAFPELKEKNALPKLSSKVRDAAGAFIKQAKAEGLTNLLAVLRTAIEYREIDTIYLLSDGAPTIGVINHAELLSQLERLNRRRKVKIHCISFHPDPSERKLLQAVADRNYGVYVER